MPAPRLTILALLGVFLVACEKNPQAETAASRAAPPLDTRPIGPTPGTLEQPASTANPFVGDADAIQTGRDLFLAYNCYGCHGGRGGGGMGPSLRDEDWLFGGSGGEIFASISQGRPHSMPAWGTKLPEELVWQLTAYIQSLGSTREPQRPR